MSIHHKNEPWEIEKSRGDEYWLDYDHYNVGPAKGIKSEADACLIASAHELLEALDWCVAEINGYPYSVIDLE